MFIVKIISEYQSDFTADLKCEHCGHVQFLSSGYHDGYYHQHVVPAINCNGCGKDRHGNYVEPATAPVRDKV